MVETRVLSVNATHPEADVVAQAAAILRRGGLVAFPTETVYGLGGLALDEASLARIFRAKGRPTHHPLIAHVADRDAARALVDSWTPEAEALAAAFWPGPLTLVLRRAGHVPSAISGGGPTLAVRVPAHPVARALTAAAGPVAAPSANRYQTISPTQAHHVLHTLEGSVELVLDGGPCAEGIESTVVDVSEPGAPVVLRPGATSLGQLQSVVPSTVARATTVAEDSLRPSPGMDRRHYAPDAFVCMVHGRAALVERVAGEGLGGRQVGVLLCGESEALAGATVRTLPSNPAAYARGLFAALHELDRSGVHAIVVEEPPSGMDWWAVRDRLERAACR